MKIQKWLLFISIFFLTASCNQNPLGELNTGSSSDALMEEMKLLLDEGEYNDAYDVAQSLLSRYPSRASSDEFKRTYGGILAGQCGFVFTTFVDNLGNATGDTLFELLLSTFSTVTVDADKCASALTMLGNLSAPTGADNLNELILHLANIGVILKASSVAPGIDVCAASGSPSANHISRTRIRRLVASFGSVITNAAEIANSISGGVGGLDALTQLCNPTPAPAPGSPEALLAQALGPICSADDPDTVTAQNAATFRRLLSDADIGIGSCTLSLDFARVRDGNNDGDTADGALVDLIGGNYSCCPNLAYNLPTEDAVEESVVVPPPGDEDSPICGLETDDTEDLDTPGDGNADIPACHVP